MNNSSSVALDCELAEPSLPLVVKGLSLAAFNLLVVCGNGLVVIAVFKYRRLRNTTGILITSLAVADLLVGTLVLPFSMAAEMTNQIWIFGEIWCQMWLAIDVWMCTASIYNLVAISLDRYVAILKPLQYRSLITSFRKRVLVAVTWIISFAICLPPILVQWPVTMSADFPERCSCSPMGNSASYIIYSAMGSFFIPFLVVMVMYARIYWTARKAYAGRTTGVMSVVSSANSSAYPTPCTLRIHRGGTVQRKSTVGSSTPTNLYARRSPYLTHTPSAIEFSSSRTVSRNPSVQYENFKINDGQDLKITPHVDRCSLEMTSDEQDEVITLKGGRKKYSNARNGVRRKSLDKTSFGAHLDILERSSQCETQSHFEGRDRRSKSLADAFLHPTLTLRRFRLAKGRNDKSKRYRRRLSSEMKAAKTVAIVTGCFICCWIGFAIVYTLQALPKCQENPDACISPTVFSIVFWLGYSNSAFNPIIYALFNKHFREAFKKIVTSCLPKNKEPLRYSRSHGEGDSSW